MAIPWGTGEAHREWMRAIDLVRRRRFERTAVPRIDADFLDRSEKVSSMRVW